MHLLLMKLNLVNQWRYRSLLPLLSFIPMLSAAILLNMNQRLKNRIEQNKARISMLEITNSDLKRQLGLLPHPSGKGTAAQYAVFGNEPASWKKPGNAGQAE